MARFLIVGLVALVACEHRAPSAACVTRVTAALAASECTPATDARAEALVYCAEARQFDVLNRKALDNLPQPLYN